MATSTPSSLFALSINGTVYVLNPLNATVNWAFPGTGNQVQVSSPVLVNINGSGGVVATASSFRNGTGIVTLPPTVHLLDLNTRQVRWSVPLTQDPTAIPVAVQAGPGRELDVVQLDNNYSGNQQTNQRALVRSASSGAVRRSIMWTGWPVSNPFSPTPFETPSGPVLVASLVNGHLLRLNVQDGTSEQIKTGCPGNITRPIPIDLDNDGFPEVLTVTFEGYVCALSVPQFNLLWSFKAVDRFLDPPISGDIDADGLPELVAITERGFVYAFDIPPVLIEPPLWGGLVAVIAAVAVGVGVIALLSVRRKRRREAP